MQNQMKLEEYLQQSHVAISETTLTSLRRLASLTALRREDGHGYFVSNFSRGPLLYGLVTANKPNAILELGTGRGYGALSMALAVSDSELKTTIPTYQQIAVVATTRSFPGLGRPNTQHRIAFTR